MRAHEEIAEFIPSNTAHGRKRKLSKINSIIIHTTGYGAGLERINKYNPGNLEAIGRAYAHRMANILKYKGHFLIDHTGKIWQFLPINETAWHTGSSKKRLLASEEPFKWWKKRWNKAFDKPTDLPVWQRGPNGSSVGIDLLAHGNGAIVKKYTQKQYESLAKLIKLLCDDLSIPIEREYILGHEDVDPISRGSKKGGWDPGKFNWDKLFFLLRKEQIGKEEDRPIDATNALGFFSAVRKYLGLWF